MKARYWPDGHFLWSAPRGLRSNDVLGRYGGEEFVVVALYVAEQAGRNLVRV